MTSATAPGDTAQLYALAEEMRGLCETRSMGRLADDEARRWVSLRDTLARSPLCQGRLPGFLRECRTDRDFWAFIKAKSPSWEGRRTVLREEFQPLLTFLEGGASPPPAATAFLEKLESVHVERAFQTAMARVDSDPEGAITAARTLVETVCKHLLDNLGLSYSDTDDLPKLYKAVATAINLSPSQHTTDVFRQILGGCTAVVEGLGALRNRLGDAHGKGRKAARPSPRHAQLVVSLAFTMSVFLVQTWEARQRPTT